MVCESSSFFSKRESTKSTYPQQGESAESAQNADAEFQNLSPPGLNSPQVATGQVMPVAARGGWLEPSNFFKWLVSGEEPVKIGDKTLV